MSCRSKAWIRSKRTCDWVTQSTLRDYVLAVDILRFLELRSIRLMTNNPEKIDAVLSSGIEIVERLSADVPASAHSAHYLATKREKMGHLSTPTSAFVEAPIGK